MFIIVVILNILIKTKFSDLLSKADYECAKKSYEETKRKHTDRLNLRRKKWTRLKI
jgi:hypothetical protein